MMCLRACCTYQVYGWNGGFQVFLASITDSASPALTYFQVSAYVSRRAAREAACCAEDCPTAQVPAITKPGIYQIEVGPVHPSRDRCAPLTRFGDPQAVYYPNNPSVPVNFYQVTNAARSAENACLHAYLGSPVCSALMSRSCD
jgi:hypothetical protein